MVDFALPWPETDGAVFGCFTIHEGGPVDQDFPQSASLPFPFVTSRISPNIIILLIVPIDPTLEVYCLGAAFSIVFALLFIRLHIYIFYYFFDH